MSFDDCKLDLNSKNNDNSLDARSVKNIFQTRTDISIIPDTKKRFDREFCLNTYKKQFDNRVNCEIFHIPDGPPYANGNIHIGHVLNKMNKIIIMQQQYMMGKRVVFRPGFDCHGLPIDKKVESEVKEKKLFDIKTNPILMRKACRDFATRWIEVQSEESCELGMIGDWSNIFTTMSSEFEILRSFYIAAANGYIYRDLKPVMWSITEKTSMATAELEYKQHESRAIDVGFTVIKSNVFPIGSKIVIWTTTPWTIPANRCIAYNKNIDYVCFEVDNAFKDTKRSLLMCVSEKLLDVFLSRLKIDRKNIKNMRKIKGKDVEGTVCSHPLKHLGYDFDVPLFDADFVRDDDGTGFVHCAPAHGEEDFRLGKTHGIPIVNVITDDGFFQNSPFFDCMSMKDGSKEILKELGDELLSSASITHSYPYSWRSHTPLIYRTTDQWYLNIGMISEKVLQLSQEISWRPQSAKNRFIGMFSDRPDWCISRQRVHGVPIAIFITPDGKPIFEKSILDKTMDFLRKNGMDSWWLSSAADILGDECSHYSKIMDVLDVWFDAGSHQYCMVKDNTPGSECLDLLLEGSDQHRGYFQAMMVLSVLTQLHDADSYKSGQKLSELNKMKNYDDCIKSKIDDKTNENTKLPICIKNISTHGFVLDAKGRKMSKSIGNVVNPQDVLKIYGLDAVRFWSAVSDYYNDVIYNKQQMDNVFNMVKKIRNTLRYLKSCIYDFKTQDHMIFDGMRQIEKSVYSRLYELDCKMKMNIQDFCSKDFYTELYTFCETELSRFYLDINKDILYCDSTDSGNRRSVLTCYSFLYEVILRWITPVMPVTALEFNDNALLLEYIKIDCKKDHEENLHYWNLIMLLREKINAEIEQKRSTHDIVNAKDALIRIEMNDVAFKFCLTFLMLDMKSVDELSELIRYLCCAGKCQIDVKQHYNRESGNQEMKDFTDLFNNDHAVINIYHFEGKKCTRCRRLFDDVNYECLCDRCGSV